MGKCKVYASTKDSKLYVHKLKHKLPLQAYKRISPLMGKQH